VKNKKPKRSKPGRPPAVEGDPAIRKTFSLRKSEFTFLRDLAKSKKMSMSATIAWAIKEAEKTIQPSECHYSEKFCKYCWQEIILAKHPVEMYWRPFNLDGTMHDCKQGRKYRQSKYKKENLNGYQKIQIEKKIAEKDFHRKLEEDD
jgi:hypothetical protein